MDILTWLVIAVTALAAGLALIAIRAPRPTWVRVTALCLTAAMLPIAYAETTEVLSRPKPIHLEWFRKNAEKTTVLSASFDEGKAIYLWLRIEDDLMPRYYVMPWSTEFASRLEDGLEEAVLQRGNIILRELFAQENLEGDFGEMNVEIMPPPIPPRKPPWSAPPRVFNPRDKGI